MLTVLCTQVSKRTPLVASGPVKHIADDGEGLGSRRERKTAGTGLPCCEGTRVEEYRRDHEDPCEGWDCQRRGDRHDRSDVVDIGHAGLLLSKGPRGRRTTRTPSFWVNVYAPLVMLTVSTDIIAEHGTPGSPTGALRLHGPRR